MLVLGLDTTGRDCSACLTRDDAVVAQASEPLGRGHAERLAPMVVELLASAGVAPPEIARLAVITGPGSFTGLRVALSYAKGFALPGRLPIIGVDRLSLALLDAPDALAVVDIRRGDMAVATFGAPPRVVSQEEADALVAAHSGPVLRDPPIDLAAACRLARRAVPAEHPPVPFYGRAPDAKLPGGVTPPSAA